ncbi:hypothetical protein IPU53_07770 [Bacillus sp. SD088]|nr:hypothetical protein [Bacillus sp. SD088]
MPASLGQALVALQADEVMVHSLGDHLLENFVEAKQIEWDMFRTQVHPWEREQYMTQY